MNKFETTRFRLKIGFAVAAVLLPFVLPFMAPFLGIYAGGKIPLSGIQVVYAVLSSEIALAVYLWGVGNWSRFEPPFSPAPSTPQTGGAPQPPGPAPGAPPAPQGGH
ncbi:MAG: hypothetical protein AUG46_11290 [Acidobacteria bacterium 13_1_20CM_3_58_11]|nr:MAG: hypothetical protein AUG46_11290 [Acidobacteria bacterium 13_1_20CM_3_58_11]